MRRRQATRWLASVDRGPTKREPSPKEEGKKFPRTFVSELCRKVCREEVLRFEAHKEESRSKPTTNSQQPNQRQTANRHHFSRTSSTQQPWRAVATIVSPSTHQQHQQEEPHPSTMPPHVPIVALASAAATTARPILLPLLKRCQP